MIERTDLPLLAEKIGMEFDPLQCDAYPFTNFDDTQSWAISDNNNSKYASIANASKREIDRCFYDRVFAEGLDITDFTNEAEAMVIPVSFDGLDDRKLHGLLASTEGYMSLRDVYLRFSVANGPEGANQISRFLGRTPGVDIPKFETNKNTGSRGQHTAGQITEAIADMKLLVPTAKNFRMARHDMGDGYDRHGSSWYQTHPAIYRHLSQRAQDLLAQAGAEDFDIHAKWTAAHYEAAQIARALDNLESIVYPAEIAFSLAELRIRQDVKLPLKIDTSKLSFVVAGVKVTPAWLIKNAMVDLIEMTHSENEKDVAKCVYWTAVQITSGILATRMALHEAQPHPLATTAQTRQTLDLFRGIKNELDGQLAENKRYALPA